jgi:hypothetical protein
MFSKLLIALRLRKPQPKVLEPAPSLYQPRVVGGLRHTGQVPPRPNPPPTPLRRYSAPAVATSPAPAPSDDFASNILLSAMLHSRSEDVQGCRREPEPEPFRAGGGGDFGGGGATASWEPPAPAPSPAYEPPAPSPS